MHGYGSHTFKWVNKEGKAHWVKFHFISDQGIKNLTHERAVELAGINPDYSTEDLFQNIQNGNGPSWTFKVQVMPLEDAPSYRWDPFDLTKVWPHADYPLREVGKLKLDRNPTNYFAEVEQASFSPAHMVPGIEASPDRVLQFRLFAYDDAARYRIGGNYLQVHLSSGELENHLKYLLEFIESFWKTIVDSNVCVCVTEFVAVTVVCECFLSPVALPWRVQVPINQCPFAKVQNYSRDGQMTVTDNGGSKPNYYPNSHEELPRPDPSQPEVHPYEYGHCLGRKSLSIPSDFGCVSG